jgi:hypothetical protein
MKTQGVLASKQALKRVDNPYLSLAETSSMIRTFGQESLNLKTFEEEAITRAH